jgi:transcriptional regulator with XRE-family HTH domain
MSASPSEPARPDELRALARGLRLDGLTRAEIARDLGVSTWRVTELLAGEPPRSAGLRTQAKDDLHERARELRLDGRTMPEIAEELGVSKASVSLWTRDLPKPPRKPYAFTRVAAARRAQWDEFLARREAERQANKAAAEQSVCGLSEREMLLVGAVLYWAEGTKDKVYDRRERLELINSDPDVIRLFLCWLELLGITGDRLVFALSIHESADLERAEAFWLGVVGDQGRWLKPWLKRHNPKSVRKNVGDGYNGCLVVRVLGSRVAYQRMDGLWHGIVGALSGVV